MGKMIASETMSQFWSEVLIYFLVLTQDPRHGRAEGQIKQPLS